MWRVVHISELLYIELRVWGKVQLRPDKNRASGVNQRFSFTIDSFDIKSITVCTGTGRHGYRNLVLNHDSAVGRRQPRAFAVHTAAEESGGSHFAKCSDLASHLGSFHDPFCGGLRSGVTLECAEGPLPAEIAEGDEPFAAAFLGDGSPHMVPWRDRQRDYRFRSREDFPPGVIVDYPVNGFMAGSRLDQIAVLEAVDANPG